MYYTIKAFNAIVTTPCNCLIEEKTIKQQNQITLFKLFLCDILSSSCNAQYFHTTGHTYTRLRFGLVKFGTGSNTELTQKYERVKVQNDIRTSKHIYKLVMCLSTNGERA